MPWLVRFAGIVLAFSLISLDSVVQYDSTTGRLLLEHAIPKAVHSKQQVWVDVNLVLETIDVQALCQGAWLNVIGYTRNTGRQIESKTSLEQGSRQGMALQAILVWSAGALRVNEYASILEDQRRVQRQFKPRRGIDER